MSMGSPLSPDSHLKKMKIFYYLERISSVRQNLKHPDTNSQSQNEKAHSPAPSPQRRRDVAIQLHRGLNFAIHKIILIKNTIFS